ncbi:MAG: cation:proton antiporter [Candidatus Asgardarchaeia archaeon]
MLEDFLYLSILILSAKIFEEISIRLKQPSIVGDVIAGIILGPAILNLVHVTSIIEFFIFLGSVFLFFLIGLTELNITLIKKTINVKIIVASLGIYSMNLIIFTYLFRLFSLSFSHALLFSSVLSLSSLGVVAKILTEMNVMKTEVGITIFTIITVLEVVGLFVSSFLIELVFTQVTFDIFHILQSIFEIGVFFLVAGTIGRYFLPKIFMGLYKHTTAKEVLFGVVMSMLFIFVIIAETIGIHGTIAALLFGLMFSPGKFKTPCKEIIKKLEGFSEGAFIPIFFAGIGLYFSWSFVYIPYYEIALVAVLVFVVRFFLAYVVTKLLQIKNSVAISSGLLSKGAADLALLLTIFELNVINDAWFSLITLLSVCTILVVPVLLNRTLKVEKKEKSEPIKELWPYISKIPLV